MRTGKFAHLFTLGKTGAKVGKSCCTTYKSVLAMHDLEGPGLCFSGRKAYKSTLTIHSHRAGSFIAVLHGLARCFDSIFTVHNTPKRQKN